MTAPAPAWTPGLLSEPDAALWLGISASTLRGLGIPRHPLPPPPAKGTCL